MNINSLGDLAMSMQMRRDTAAIKSELARATNEISSGYTSDILGSLKGDFSRLSSVESDLVRMEGYRSNIDEFDLLLSAQQGVLQKIRQIGTVSSAFLSVPVGVTGPALSSFGAEGLTAFDATLQALNVQSGGRSVFSGTATDRSAVGDLETILTAIELEVSTAAATTAVDVETVVDTWFAVGGGFDALGYTGGAASDTPIHLSDSEVANPLVTAQDDAIRHSLASHALAALVGRDLLSGDVAEQANLIRRSGEKLLQSDSELINLQSRIGLSEAVLERASVEVQTQKDALTLTKAELVEVDAYEAATRLQNAELRLQSIYTLTGRLSRLSLTEYL